MEDFTPYVQRLFEVTGVTEETGYFYGIVEGTSDGVEGYFYVFEGLSELGTEITGKYQVFVFVAGDLA